MFMGIGAEPGGAQAPLESKMAHRRNTNFRAELERQNYPYISKSSASLFMGIPSCHTMYFVPTHRDTIVPLYVFLIITRKKFKLFFKLDTVNDYNQRYRNFF